MGKRGKEIDLVRCQSVRDLFLSGLTQREIGSRLNVSRQRINQILQQSGTNGRDGGIALRTTIKRRNDLVERQSYYNQSHGIEEHQFNHPFIKNLYRNYMSQKMSARKRGIKWDFEFWQWLDVWGSSNMLPFRGQGEGKYCMARIGDIGPYEKDNVYICTNLQNSKDVWANKSDMKIRLWSGKNKSWNNLTHCLHGHDRKIFFYRTPSGHPVCRACNSIATKKYYKKTLAIKKNMVYN
jgi:hypothetical protein